ncbi:MAG: hypothetical protein J0L82_08510 [Deltaproteobacteria bacterium]|nr:hypothetical protein [Deltaproteobacteria bacterium]
MKKKSNTILGSLGSVGLAHCISLVLSTFAFSPAHAGSDLKPLKTLHGLHLSLIDGSIVSNCTMNTPQLCQSRKDINISQTTSSFMKQTLEQMIPGQQRWAKNQAEIKAINEENERLKGSGEELKIAKNIARLVELHSEVHSDNQPLKFTPFLWAPDLMKFGASRREHAEDREDLGDISDGTITMNHVLFHSLTNGANRYLDIGGDSYSIARNVTYSYNPNMEMSFVVQINSAVRYPGDTNRLYATEEVVARCEERRIYNTIFDMKTTLADRHVICKLPENMGSLRFKIVK